jgi:hypothetical protein
MRIGEYISDNGNLRIVLKDDIKNLWAIMDCGGLRMSRTFNWSIEPIPSNRTEEYIKEHSFSLKEAKEILRKKDQCPDEERE